MNAGGQRGRSRVRKGSNIPVSVNTGSIDRFATISGQGVVERLVSLHELDREGVDPFRAVRRQRRRQLGVGVHPNRAGRPRARGLVTKG